MLLIGKGPEKVVFEYMEAPEETPTSNGTAATFTTRSATFRMNVHDL